MWPGRVAIRFDSVVRPHWAGRASHPVRPSSLRSKLRVNCCSVSLDGYGAGPRPNLSNPLGVDGSAQPARFFPTRTFQTTVLGPRDGTTGIDDDFVVRGMAGVGRGFSAAMDLARSAGRGRTIHGNGGGATTLPTTCPCSC